MKERLSLSIASWRATLATGPRQPEAPPAMTTHFSVQMRTADDLEFATTVSVDAPVSTDDGREIARIAKDIFATAARQIVEESSQGRHAPFGQHELIPLSMTKNGPAKRYVVDALYPEDGGPFGDSAEAVDVADAEFQVLWTMSENIASEYGNEMKRLADLDDFLDRMAGITLIDAIEEPVRKEDAYALFAKLVLAHESGDDLDGPMAEARGMLESLGHLEPLSTDVDEDAETDEPSPRM